MNLNDGKTTAERTAEDWGRWVAAHYSDYSPGEEWDAALARRVYAAVSAAIAEAVAAERERCALVVRGALADTTDDGGEALAAAIRRGPG